jgi:hypothetical protein
MCCITKCSNIYNYMRWLYILNRILLVIIALFLTGVFFDSIATLGIPPSIPTDIAASATKPLRTIYDAFPGISRAIPGTFHRILIRWINIQASISTTTSRVESFTTPRLGPSTTSLDSASATEIVANAARAAITASFVVAAVYLSCAVVILISRYYW